MPSLEERGAIERTFHWVTHYATWRGGAGGAPPVVTMGDKHGGQRFVRTASATTAAATTAATTAGGSPGGKTRPGGKARPGGGGGHTADRRLGAMATSPRRTLPPAPPAVLKFFADNFLQLQLIAWSFSKSFGTRTVLQVLGL